METSAKPAAQPVRLLLIQESPDDLVRLQDLILSNGNGQIVIDSVGSMEDARGRLEGKNYDIAISTSRIAQPTQAHCTPVLCLPLESGLNDEQIRQQLQLALCNYRRQCAPTDQCMALATLGALARYQKERQTQTTEELLRKLRRSVEQSPDLVMITDSSGVLEYVNPAFETVSGYSRQEVIGQTLGILKSEQEPGELYEEMWSTVLSGKAFHGIVTNRKKNGESFVLQKAITPLRNSRGEITHFISTGRDITEQHRLEAQLQQAQKMDAIGRLAGGVAHDFNNLLMVISAYAELMTDSLPAGDPLRHNIAEIITASRRAADLTRQLLAFGRKQMQSLQVLDLNNVIDEVCRMLPRLIGEDIQLTLVKAEQPCTVTADSTQIEQIIMNLAANARDAMPEGGKLTIETQNVRLDESYIQSRPMVPRGDYVQLTVTDSGTGIAKEDLPHVFEPFFTTKEKGKGTGLGLATVYGIVKQSGGFIWVYSEPELGTTFKIYFPRVANKGSEALCPSESTHPISGTETVLLVEDEIAVRQSTREFLARQGYTVLEAPNGEEALRVSREYCGPIHMLISDVVMPKMSGPKLAEQLAAERPQMRVLFVSGYAEQTVLRHGKINLITGFLQKPFCLNTLAGKIREVIARGGTLAHAATSSH